MGEARGWGSRTGGALQEGVSVVRECLHHLLHHRQLAVVRFVGEVDVVRHPSHGEWVGGHGCRALGRRVSVPGRRETIDRAFDRTHRLAPRIDARARRDRPTHRFRRDARTDMLGTWGTEATTFTERGGFWSNSSLVRERTEFESTRRRPLSNVDVQTTTRGRHGGSTGDPPSPAWPRRGRWHRARCAALPLSRAPRAPLDVDG